MSNYDYGFETNSYTPEQIAAVERCYPDGRDLSDRVVAQAMAIEHFLTTGKGEGIDRDDVFAAAQLVGRWPDGRGNAYRVQVSVYGTHTDGDGTTYDGYKAIYWWCITV